MRRSVFRKFLWTFFWLFLVLNIVAAMHAYKFMHFSSAPSKTNSHLSALQKLKIIVSGIDFPRPKNIQLPKHPFERVEINSNKKIEAWVIKKDSAKGTVILFHGYGGEKSSMLDKAEVFFSLGYNTILVDFMGSGGSEGSATTIGFKEAQEVKDCFNYALNRSYPHISLFGTSMGAAAIMRSMAVNDIKPEGIILECPFGTMYETVCARFHMQNIPVFPMAGLLVFWGGVENGFWAFAHNPSSYASHIKCPTLLLYGEMDEKVSRQEINTIFNNLNGKKKLVTYPHAGHENYLLKYHQKWVQDISQFMLAMN